MLPPSSPSDAPLPQPPMRPSPQYRAMLRFALFSLLPAAFACAASTASAADPAPAYRDLEGRLSSLEEDLFSDVLDGRLDRFSLFSAALVAGGTRDRGRIAEYEARLDALLKRLRPRVAEKTSELAKAREIFRFMHGEILTGGVPSGMFAAFAASRRRPIQLRQRLDPLQGTGDGVRSGDSRVGSPGPRDVPARSRRRDARNRKHVPQVVLVDRPAGETRIGHPEGDGVFLRKRPRDVPGSRRHSVAGDNLL